MKIVNNEKLRCEMCGAEMTEFWINGVRVDASVFYDANTAAPGGPNFAGLRPGPSSIQ